MQQYPAQYPTSRPRLPDIRPHTVHSLPDHCFSTDVFHQDYTERQEHTTPRASLPRGTFDTSALYARPGGRRLSRDDTAADMSEIVWSTAPNNTELWGTLRSSATSQARHAVDEDGAATSAPFVTAPLPFVMNALQYEEESMANKGDAAVAQSRQARSLGRRFSRTYKEKFSELKDSMNKRAPRLRRASTPHNVEAGAHVLSERQVGFVHVAPLSPSKRNSRYPDPRAKKFRSPWGNTGDRKDTPAPVYGNTPAAPALNIATRPAPHPQHHMGGESARKAAAAYRYQSQLLEAWLTPEEQQDRDLQQRRGRVGSLSSAADSGADLSRIDFHSCNDSVGDVSVDIFDADMDFDYPNEEPPRIDFVTSGKLPTEICLQVFEYLDAADLERARHVGPQWGELCSRTSVWRTAYLRKWGRQIHTDPAPVLVGGAGVGRPNKPDQQWREMYKARMELERNWRRGAQVAGKAIYLSGHTDSVYCVQFDEEKIITGSRDRTIRVWDINTFQCIRVIGGPNVKPTLGPKVLRTVDYPSFHLATASVNGTAYGDGIYHVPREWHDASILCLQYDEEILVTGSSDSDLLVWDVKTYQPIKRLKKHTGGVLDVALDGKHIISCSKDSRIIVWDRKTLEYRGELTGHRGPVNAVQLRGKYLVSASGDGIARMWDIEAMKLVKEFGQKERGLAAVEFAEDMKHVLAGGNDNITYKFEVESGKEVMQYTGHSQLVRSLWLDSANSRVVSGSYDLDLRVYDLETGQEIWRAEEWTTSWMLAAKSDYRRIVATSQDGRILCIDFGLKKGGLEDGQPIDGVDLLRGVENTNAITWRRINWGA